MSIELMRRMKQVRPPRGSNRVQITMMVLAVKKMRMMRRRKKRILMRLFSGASKAMVI
jgi:hypothetical protein